MRGLVAGLVALIVFAPSAVGCGGDSSDESAAVETVTVEKTVEEKEPEGTTLQVAARNLATACIDGANRAEVARLVRRFRSAADSSLPSSTNANLIRVARANLRDGCAPQLASRIPKPRKPAEPEPAPAEPEPADEPLPEDGGGDTGGGITVPNVVGQDHQLAQDTMQAAGLYILDEKDCTGQGRLLLWDRNWVVVEQDPPAGTSVSAADTITLCSKKDGE